MEQKQFIMAINQICDEKGIPKEKAMEIVEAALAAAYKKDYGKKGQVITVKFDEKTGGMEVYQIKTVAEEVPEGEIEDESESVEADEKSDKKRFNPDKNITVEEAKKYLDDPKIDDEVRIELPVHTEFGRIAAQTAKQVMIQRIREAEKEAIFNEFKDKEGEVVNGIVQRIEGRNVFVDVGKAIGVIYPMEQIYGEHYRIGQRLKVYIAKIDKETKDSNLVLSRTNANIIKKMFEIEVPEISNKTVEIKSIAREAGSRTKIAVTSNEEGIDPVGSCVGQRGSRIQTIINELGGEKIDIIEWNENVKKFIQHALSPAKVSRIDIDEKTKSAMAFVAGDQLSLAIGKQGQNVRLAAKLTGWKIDVVEKRESDTENESKQEAAKANDDVAVKSEKTEAPEKDEEKSDESKKKKRKSKKNAE
ncbi:MAG: transcription termination factor NusA [Candidatus Paceibacterota bacterium]|jgi:N utilization substance protein A